MEKKIEVMEKDIRALKKRFSRNVYGLDKNLEVFGKCPTDPETEERLANDGAVKPYSIPVKWTVGELWHYPKKDSDAPDFFINVIKIELTKKITIYRYLEDEVRFLSNKKYRHCWLKIILGLD